MESNFLGENHISLVEDLQGAFLRIGKKALFVVDRSVYDLYPLIRSFLEGRSFLLLEVSEGMKTLETVERIYGFLLEHHVGKEPLVAIGGGITGDIAGFASGTFKRGIPFILVPTTIVSQCDSSVGGKTGVNFRGYKNYVGLFHKPSDIILWKGFLNTLPDHERKNGYGELLKYALVGDPTLLSDLKNEILDEDTLHGMVMKGLRIKAELVKADYRDEGLRNILNFGHTVGHAIEADSDGEVSHGEAVGIGLVAEGILSVKMLGLDESVLRETRRILKTLGMEDHYRIRDRERFLSAITKDKKNDEHVRLTLLEGLAKPKVRVAVPPEKIMEVMEEGMDDIDR
jgi:3-dehydroquinate synthase